MLIVHKRIHRKQWFALILLFIGVSLVQLPKDNQQQSSKNKDRLMGLLAVVACCMSSGFSGVYFERLIKINAKQPLWIRNFQLALLCFLMSTVGMFYQDYGQIRAHGLFQGYSNLVWSLVMLQAFGGLIVAAVVKHADNVLKGFATSCSIILSTLLSYLLFDDFDAGTSFYVGATIVITSTIMYNL